MSKIVGVEIVLFMVAGVCMGIIGEVFKSRNEVWVGSGEGVLGVEMRVVCDGVGSCDWNLVKGEVK